MYAGPAGKSTTFSIICGTITPSRGKCYIAGLDLSTSMSKCFAMLGVCPQHEILFADLTVKQHLLFFARLRYQSNDEVRSAVYETTKAIQLEGQLSKLPAQLSGGMRRRSSFLNQPADQPIRAAHPLSHTVRTAT